FVFILARTLVRLGSERLAHKPGSRFKTKMVLGAIAVSFLPVIFLFFVSYALLNRTLVLWFPRPLEIATESSRSLVNEMSRADADRMSGIAKEVAGAAASDSARDTMHAFDQTFARGADLAWEVDAGGHPFAVAANPNLQFQAPKTGPETNSRLNPPALARQLPDGTELWEYGGKTFLAGRAKTPNSSLLAGRIVPDDFQERIKEIDAQKTAYEQQRQHLRT